VIIQPVSGIPPTLGLECPFLSSTLHQEENFALSSRNGFTVRLTTDQNLRYPQNLQQAGVAVVVLLTASNRLPDLLPLLPEACKVLDAIAPGEVSELGKA
jgi:hypothetical protein